MIALRIFAYGWIVIAVLLIFGVLCYFDGFRGLLGVLSPLNFVNYIAVGIALAPAVTALSWAGKIERKQLVESATGHD